jgi:threonine dehydratase
MISLDDEVSVTINDIREAHERIKKYIIETPIANSPTLAGLCGCDLHLKLETLQRGSR